MVYAALYTYQATLNNTDLVGQMQAQHQEELKNMMGMADDINYNNGKLATTQDTIKTRLENVQLSLVKYINDNHQQLLQQLDVTNVKNQLTDVKSNLLKQIISTNNDMLKTMVEKETTLHSRIDNVDSKYAQKLVDNAAVIQTAVQKNIDLLGKTVTSYSTSNDKKVEQLYITLLTMKKEIDANNAKEEQNLETKIKEIDNLILGVKDQVKNINDSIASTAAANDVSPATRYSRLMQNTLYIDNNTMTSGTNTGKLGLNTNAPNATLEIKDVNNKPRLRVTGTNAGVELGSANSTSSTYSRVMSDGTNNMHLFTNNSQDVVLQGPNNLPSDIPANAGTGRVIIGKPATAVGADRKLVVAGPVTLTDKNDLEFGGGITNKGNDNGKIAYQKWSTDALDITGAGTASGTNNRKVKVWAEGGTEFTGPVNVTNTTNTNTIKTCGLSTDTTTSAGRLVSDCPVKMNKLVIGNCVLMADPKNPNTLITNCNFTGQNTDAKDTFVGGPVESFSNTAMVPIGAIIMWNGTTPPDGWMLCDGSSRPRSDGTGNITAPDLRSRFVISMGNGPGLTTRSLGDKGGREIVGLSVDNIPPHTHSGSTENAGNHNHYFEDYYYAENNGQNWGWAGSRTGMDWDNRGYSRGAHTSDAGNHTHSFTTNSTGSGSAFSIMPPLYALAFIMKY
jgi:microcystin-dependent protein